MKSYTPLLLIVIMLMQCQPAAKEAYTSDGFPAELVHFVPYAGNPVFTATGANTWDKEIRERGYILHEDSLYHLWYNGYTHIDSVKWLGYATSPDGFTWTRFPGNPIYDKDWVEDMCVVKEGNTYYMFAEGRGDTAHLLTSTDRIHWTEQGNLDIRKKDGSPITPGSYGTPFVMKEKDTWHLFYERGDLGIWLATSKDLATWTNVQDEPVLRMGPEAYDRYGVAMNQVVRYNGRYYGYYHATAYEDWHEWSTNVAVSDDLIHWTKYAGNPIVGNNKSSGILVHDGRRYRLYTMHPEVNVYFPVTDSLP